MLYFLLFARRYFKITQTKRFPNLDCKLNIFHIEIKTLIRLTVLTIKRLKCIDYHLLLSNKLNFDDHLLFLEKQTNVFNLI